ncbi:hypothetical protein NAEGRDRAFT_80305 [Naegleria gruberi]|uniref:Uncharacterized protein n=1 Tax=Naegleria gruberi TaxID=5762 RepID=D2VKG3_NAEGR|nr:uncharacterized protein NAEGRDRAFT_80305 [Naegleria gruberi]EFC42685.1 hypothetical protein NAEGRDRAFT_80305 [Naegleria gruberi]|eukprot:XP_002675429.1 hypothetical protein NAEGRDRAFT_80305 [Naegleria gruberi strain NEG-M]
MADVDLPSITSSNSKLKTLRTLNSIHKEITSILNPNLEQCRFLCPVTQIISETKHRVVLLTLIYHRQNGGEYAIFLFNENLKLRDCIPIKNYSFFVQIRNVKTPDEKVQELNRKRKESMQSDSSDYDDYEDDYTPSEEKDVFAKSNRLVLYHVVNENETQEFVFSFDNDQQLLQFTFALSNICDKDPSFKLGFDQIFEIPSELENILNREEYYDEVRGDSQPQFIPPHGYQFITSTSDIKSHLKQSNMLLQMSQQFASLKHQITLKSNDLKFMVSQQMLGPNNKRLSAKFALGSPIVGSLGMTSSPVNTGGLTVSEKRKSLTPTGILPQSSGQQIIGQSTLTSLLKSHSGGSNSQTPTPFDWVLFFIERFELDANEIEFLNPLYQNMENSGSLDCIRIVENRKDKLVEQDVVSITKDDSNTEDEYAWLMKRSEQEIENHIKSIPRVIAAKPSNTAAKPLNTVSSFTKTSNQTIRQVSTPSQNNSQPTTSPNKPITSSNPISTTPSTTAAQPMVQSPPTIESNFMQSELLSKLYNNNSSAQLSSSPSNNANSNNTPKSATSTPTTTTVPTTKIIGSKQAQQQQQQQKDDSDSDISLSMSSSDSDEDEEDDLDMSSTDEDSD